MRSTSIKIIITLDKYKIFFIICETWVFNILTIKKYDEICKKWVVFEFF